MITVSNFRIKFPEFEDAIMFTDARIQMSIDEAVIVMTSEDRWLDWYELAQYYLVGHLLAIANASESGSGDARFPVSGQVVDDVSISQAVAAANPSGSLLFTTIYGQAYYRYLRMTFAGIYGV